MTCALAIWLCLTGPSPQTPGMLSACRPCDRDLDGDVDLADLAVLQNEWRNGESRNAETQKAETTGED